MATDRAVLRARWGVTLLFWLNDDSEDNADSWAFLDRRIGNVMEIEKLKGRFKPPAERPSLTRFLGRLRYPVEG